MASSIPPRFENSRHAGSVSRRKFWMGIGILAIAIGGFMALRPASTDENQNPQTSVADASGSGGPSGSVISSAMNLSEPLNALNEKPLALGEGIPSDILAEMHRCLKSKDMSSEGLQEPAAEMNGPQTEAGAAESQVKVYRTEEALTEIEKELGPAMMQGDLWTDWVVKLPEGMDRKVHLENIEDETGRIQQNLSLFQIDQSGKASRVSMTETEERNPDMVMISKLLNEGEIQRKESSRFYQYATGERLEVIELDGRPTELEIVRGEVFFRCDKMESTENCTCIR